MKNSCQCCDKVGPLVSTKSQLKRGISFSLCESCSVANHQPRFWLILFGRANGVRSIDKQVRGGLYCGPELLLREVI